MPYRHSKIISTLPGWWEWPLLKKETLAPAILWSAVHIERSLRIPTFLTSLLQWSACRLNHTDRKSILAAILVRPQHNSSAVLELPAVRLGDKATITRWACTSSVVEAKRGLLKLENSLLDMHLLRGHACFCASMLSKIAHISVSPSVVAHSLLRARAA